MKYIKNNESFLDIFSNKKDNIIIRTMKASDVQKALDIKYQYFNKFYEDKKSHDKYTRNKLDIDVSLIAENDNREIVGAYFLTKSILPNSVGNFYKFNQPNLIGIEGISIFVDPKYKKLGIGKKLINYYKTNTKGIDFIWGKAFHGLNNIHHWLSRRELFNDKYGVYHTIEFYNGKNINMFNETVYKEFYEKNEDYSIPDVIYDELEELDESELKLPNHKLLKFIPDDIYIEQVDKLRIIEEIKILLDD